MFDIGFLELLVISVVSLLIMGPERLPGAVRTATLWIGRLRRSFQNIQQEIEKEAGVNEIKQQLHNESIMKSLTESKQQLENEIKQTADPITADFSKLQHEVNSLTKSDPVADQLNPDTDQATTGITSSDFTSTSTSSDEPEQKS